MFHCTVLREPGTVTLAAEGRIDGLAAPELEQRLNELVDAGDVRVYVDLAAVTFVSSAGLRVFLKAQKRLQPVGGAVVLVAPTASVHHVFRASGFTKLLTVVDALPGPESLSRQSRANRNMDLRRVGSMTFHGVERDIPAPAPALRLLGNVEKLAHATYEEADVVQVHAPQARWGAGLGTLGDHFADYKDSFGEVALLGGSFFSYPAVPHSAVDFTLATEPSAAYRFLHGFAWSGDFRLALGYNLDSASVDLDALASALVTLADAPAIGFAVVAESRGIWGMNLRKVPLHANAPAHGAEIFADLPRWFAFPVEPSDYRSLLVVVGVARSADATGPILEATGTSLHHVHAVLVAPGPVGKSPDAFETEVARVLHDHAPQKVQHLLGRSRLGPGLAAIVPLGG